MVQTPMANSEVRKDEDLGRGGIVPGRGRSGARSVKDDDEGSPRNDARRRTKRSKNSKKKKKKKKLLEELAVGRGESGSEGGAEPKRRAEKEEEAIRGAGRSARSRA